MVIVLLADGFEEIEALTPVDMLRRAGLDVKTVGMNGKIVCGSHRIPVICDLLPEEVELSAVSLAIFPGGMPGAENLNSHPFTDKVIDAVTKNGGRLAAICAAPLILGRRGLLSGKCATCYPGFEGELTGAVISDESVVTDGNITTAKGMGVSLKFAEELIMLTLGEDKARELSVAVMQEVPYEAKKDNLGFHLTAKDEEDIEEISERADAITHFYEERGISIRVCSIDRGHIVTAFGIEADDNTDAERIYSLAGELEDIIKRKVRFYKSIENTVMIEIPHNRCEKVYLKDAVSSFEFVNAPSATTVAMGMDTSRNPVFADAKRASGMLVGGDSASSRISFLHNIIISICKKASPDEANFAIVGKELEAYCTLPHLYGKVARNADSEKALLKKIVAEKMSDKPGTVLFVVCDLDMICAEAREYVDYILKNGKEHGIYVLASVGRECSISADALSEIKCRACFRTSDAELSKKVIGTDDASKLVYGSDMLLRIMNAKTPIRLTTPEVTPEELCGFISEYAKKYASYEN
ncbi:MAG: DJ-1/PfpI family protein [Clostridia bacterium]|nr:DJ-1/PfpI family protein [Clostridia bacterium]